MIYGTEKSPLTFSCATALVAGIALTLTTSTGVVVACTSGAVELISVGFARLISTGVYDIATKWVTRMDGTEEVLLLGTVAKGDALEASTGGAFIKQSGTASGLVAAQAGVAGEYIPAYAKG